MLCIEIWHIYIQPKDVIIYDAHSTSKPLFVEISRLSLVSMEDIYSFIPGVLFCPFEIHLIVKVILSEASPIEYSVIITNTCLQLIQRNITDWTIGYEHVHYQCIVAIVGHMVHKSAITST